MNTSLLKKIVASVAAHGATEQVLELVDILLVMMKKYGKQVSQPSFLDFLAKEYPDVLALYRFVGGSRFTIKQCLLFRQYLREAMGDDFWMVTLSDQHGVDYGDKLWKDALVRIGQEAVNPSLSVHSKKKVYQRSLYSDLHTLLGK